MPKDKTIFVEEIFGTIPLDGGLMHSMQIQYSFKWKTTNESGTAVEKHAFSKVQDVQLQKSNPKYKTHTDSQKRALQLAIRKEDVVSKGYPLFIVNHKDMYQYFWQQLW